jgi:hypothetical protein
MRKTLIVIFFAKINHGWTRRMKEVTVSTRDGFLNDGLLRKLKVEKSKQGERRKPVREKRKRIVFGEGIQCFSFAKGGTNSPVTCILQKLT